MCAFYTQKNFVADVLQIKKILLLPSFGLFILDPKKIDSFSYSSRLKIKERFDVVV